MAILEPPNSHFLSAAEGWMELGDFSEARAELNRIETNFRNHPQVLQIGWEISAQEKNWPAALEAARALTTALPDHPYGWLHQAYALRRVPDGGLDAAWDSLFPMLEKFPAVAMIPYNLACYACQLGNWDQARELLRRSLKIGDEKHIKEIALDDADLKPLWPEIREL